MKTIKFIALSMMIMFASTTVNATPSKNKNTTPAVAVNNVVKNSNKNYMTTYKMDAQGRVVNKVVFKSVDGQWNPIGAYSVFYGESENIVTYAQWDKDSQTFTRNAVQQHFDSKDYPVVLTSPTK